MVPHSAAANTKPQLWGSQIAVPLQHYSSATRSMVSHMQVRWLVRAVVNEQVLGPWHAPEIVALKAVNDVRSRASARKNWRRNLASIRI